MNQPKSMKWKEHFLRSSLPLEYLIINKLDEIGINVCGEYPFLKPNENGIITEFSADIRAFQLLEKTKEHYWGIVEFLIECKYSHPSVKWIFSPVPDNEDIILGYISIFQDLSVNRIKTDDIYEFDSNIPYCMKGVVLLGNNVNLVTIKTGLSQLRYSSVQLSRQCLANQIGTCHDEELQIDFLCPIMVTNAPLYVIKPNLSINDFQNAKDIDSIANNVDTVIVNQSHDLLLKKYIERNVYELCDDYKELNQRLKDFSDILKDSNYKDYFIEDVFFLHNRLGNASERILIVNYNSFSNLIEKILTLLNSARASLRRYAYLKFDSKTRLTSIIKSN